MFNTKIIIDLEPTFYKECPRICWGVDGTQHDVELHTSTQLVVDQAFETGKHCVEIFFYNKSSEDSVHPVDKAVIIKSISVEGLSTTKISQGIYCPEFPEPWASQQVSQGINLFETYKSSTYLGWNGRWRFEFESPIYQWIHKTENLGFYYR
jgi:hypothetical protein